MFVATSMQRWRRSLVAPTLLPNKPPVATLPFARAAPELFFVSEHLAFALLLLLIAYCCAGIRYIPALSAARPQCNSQWINMTWQLTLQNLFI